MKSMLIAAATLGAGIAGLLLYARRQNKPLNRIEAATSDAYKTANRAIGAAERPAQHAMG